MLIHRDLVFQRTFLFTYELLNIVTYNIDMRDNSINEYYINRDLFNKYEIKN